MPLRIIGGRFRGRLLRPPSGRKVRPTADRVRESLFNILGNRVAERVVYDLFAGSGALGIEALSRDASRAVFVERNRGSALVIRENLRMLNLSLRATVVMADVFAWVQREKDWPAEPALVFLDPPYEEYRRRPQRMVELLERLRQRLPAESIVVVEHDPGFDVSQVGGRWDVRRYGQTQLALSTIAEDQAGPSKEPEPMPNQRQAKPIATSADEHFAREVVERLQRAGFRALWAGGCVRDMLLGRQPEDYDVATDARPEQVREVFGRRRTVAVGASFGVVEVLGRRGVHTVQVATFRSDLSYSDGRHPDRVEFGGPEADARRRDFTINGMFYDPLAGQVLDFVGGRQDLEAGLIRAIGDPDERFTEDKLRLLRAVRFSATLGFPMDEQTERAVRARAPEIRVVSAERIAEELRRMLEHPQRARAMQQTFDLGLAQVVLPELVPMKGVPQDKPVQPNADLWDHTLLVLEKLQASWRTVCRELKASEADVVPFALGLAALLHDVGKPATRGQGKGKLTFHHHEHVGREISEEVCRRLKLSNDQTGRICWLVEHHMYLGEAKQLRWAKLKRILVEPGIAQLLALHWADALASTADTGSIQYCLEVLRTMPEDELNPPPLLTGHDLIRHGVQRGPIYAELLETVRDAQLENRIRSKRDALTLVDQMLQERRDGDRMPGD